MADRQATMKRILELEAEIHRGAGSGLDTWVRAGLTMLQARALDLLATGGPLPIGRLAREFGTSVASASELADRLAASGLAERVTDPSDRRMVRVRATRKGAALARRLREAGSVAVARLVDALPDEDLDVVVRGMEALARAARTLRGRRGGRA